MRDLVARTTKLNRQIFASMPWGYRVAHLFVKLAMDTAEIFGRVAYAEFIKAGVQGLPDVNGRPALELQEKFKGSRAADRLPQGYGKRFGVKAWHIALVKLKNPEIVEDAVGDLMSKLISGKLRLQEGVDLKKAENFVITSLLNAGIDALRRRKYQESQLPTDSEGNELDMGDPNTFRELENLVSRADMAKIMSDLRNVHERAPSWVEAQMEGLTDRELAAEWGVDTSAVFNWKKRYLDAVKAVFFKYVRDAA